MRALLAAAVAALVLVGCGGDEDGGAGGDGPTTVKVGTLPIDGLEPLYIAMKRGFFEEEWLKVVPQQAQGGAAIVPGVVSGELQFGFSNNVSLLIASSKGLPLRIVANGTDGDTEPPYVGFSVVVSKRGGPIRGPADLRGKRVAVNTLNNIGPVTIQASLQRRGIDPRGLKFVEVPFPEMLTALARGSVDAAWLVEPFSTQAKAQDTRVLMRPYHEAMRGRSIATYFTSRAYAQRNPEVVTRFKRALDRAIEHSARNPDEVRRTLPTYTKIPADVARRMVISVFSTDVRREDFEYLAGLSRRYGLIDEVPDIGALLGR